MDQAVDVTTGTAYREPVSAMVPVPGNGALITIRIEAYGSGSLVHVLSRSFGGRGDFGQNARNIRQFQAALEEQLSLARPVGGLQ